MNICEVIAGISATSGGTASFMSDLSKYLADPDFSFRILTAQVAAGSQALPIDPSVALSALPVKRAKLTRQVRRVGAARVLDSCHAEDRIDCVHLHGLWLDIGRDAAKWSRKRKVDFVVSPHGMLEPWALKHKKWKKDLALFLFQRRDLNQAKAFHACSAQEADNIRRLGFKQPIAVIPNGVELPEIRGQGSEIREDNQRTALFLSRINPKKGLPMLLDAWKLVAPANWRLVIAGNDDAQHLPEVEAKIVELGLSEVVEIVGPLFGAAKEHAFREADLFVLPSYSENFGIVVTEALGYEVPVLTTTGCPWQELETKGCGWWVDPTPEGIESGLKSALNTAPHELVQMGVRGRELVIANYLWPAIADKFRSFYAWLLKGGKKPDFVI